MEILSQAILIVVCMCIYATHMISIPLLMSMALLEFRRQRQMATDEFAAKPTEWEYFGVRLFLAFLLADVARGIDGGFDNAEDGTLRSVWGLTRMDVRFFAWWIRDACLFRGLVHCHEFYTGWAEIVLRRAPSRMIMHTLRICAGFAVLGLAVSFYNLLATNRQFWQIIAALMIFPVNAVSAFVSARLLWDLLPQIKQLRIRRDGHAVELMASRAQTVFGLILFFNAIILTVFPCLCVQKIVYTPLSSPLVPNQRVDVWVGDSRLPSILDLPQEAPSIWPSPALEIVEVALGWFFLSTWWPSYGYNAKGQKVEGSFISHITIGKHMLGNIDTDGEGDQTKVVRSLRDHTHALSSRDQKLVMRSLKER